MNKNWSNDCNVDCKSPFKLEELGHSDVGLRGGTRRV